MNSLATRAASVLRKFGDVCSAITKRQAAVLLTAASILFVAVLGALRIAEPFEGDDAIFLLGAKVMDSGGAYYVDFWDIKQPGIFYFFLFGGRTFGFDAIGIHTFELVYWIFATLVLTWALRDAFHHRWLSVLVPTLFLTSYFAFADLQVTTQLEILVGPLVLLSIALLVHGERDTPHTYLAMFAAGVLAGIVAVFRIPLGIIFVGFLFVSAHGAWIAAGRNISSRGLITFLGRWAAYAVGVSVVLALLVLEMWRAGALADFLTTSFILPGQVMASAEMAPVSRLVHGFIWFCAFAGPWLPLIFAAILLRDYVTDARWDRHMVAWLVCGLLAIVVQRFSWWTYHFLILLPPTAFLAVRGLDQLLSYLQHHYAIGWRSKLCVLGLCLLPAFAMTMPVSLERAKAVWRLTSDKTSTLERHYRDRFPEFDRLATTADLVRPLEAGATVYVMGNPVIYDILNVGQALSYHGWGIEYATPQQWRNLHSELIGKRPNLIFLSHDYRALVEQKGAEIIRLLGTDYAPAGKSHQGEWFKLN